MRKRLLAGTQAVPALPGLSARLCWHSHREGRSGPALCQAVNHHSSQFVTLMRRDTLCNAIETQQVCFAHATAALADTATCFGSHWHGKHSKHFAEIRGSPSSPAWDTLTSPPSLLLGIVQNTKICPLCFQNVSVSQGSPPTLFFLRPIKNKSLPERQAEWKKKKKEVWYHWIQPVRISHIKELCPWALSNRLSENFIFLLPWLDSLFE